MSAQVDASASKIKNCFICGRFGARQHLYDAHLSCKPCAVSWSPIVVSTRPKEPWRRFTTVNGVTELIWYDDHTGGLRYL